MVEEMTVSIIYLKSDNVDYVYWCNRSVPKGVPLESWWNKLGYEKKAWVKEYDFDKIMDYIKSKFELDDPNFEELKHKLQHSYDTYQKEDTQELDEQINKNHRDYIILANKHYYLHEYEDAIESYQKAIELNPEDAGAYYNMGISYDNIEAYEKAIEAYQKAIELNPEDAGVYYNMGISYDNIEAYEKAIEAYQKAIELNPEDARAYNNMGVSYENLERYVEAIEAYQKAIELNPEDASAYNNMGVSYENLERYVEAIEAYQKAIELNPEDARAYNNMGDSYSKKNAHLKAIEAYQKAIELNPEYANAYINLIKSYIINEKPIDETIEKKFLSDFAKDKKRMMIYDMLKIFQQISLGESYNIDDWIEQYKENLLDSWSFRELEKWIENKNGTKQKNMMEVLKIFKAHNA